MAPGQFHSNGLFHRQFNVENTLHYVLFWDLNAFFYYNSKAKDNVIHFTDVLRFDKHTRHTKYKLHWKFLTFGCMCAI